MDYTDLLVEIRDAVLAVQSGMDHIDFLLTAIFTVLIVDFVMSCMRAWRKNTLKGV